nr:TdeIII family type II restriction endonuclease [Candidatus Cloacimonadota bacterium]
MIAISKKTKEKITEQIQIVVNKYLEKADTKPKANSANPFVMALLKDFDPLMHRIHGLKTSLGCEMEKIAEIIAIESWGKNNVRRKFRENVTLPSNVYQIIDSIIDDLSNARTLSHYENEKNKILNAIKKPSTQFLSHTYEFDLELKDNTNNEIYCLEMKGPDPNTTEVPGAKRRLLAALANNVLQHRDYEVNSLLAIYYNNKFPKPYKNAKVLYY